MQRVRAERLGKQRRIGRGALDRLRFAVARDEQQRLVGEFGADLGRTSAPDRPGMMKSTITRSAVSRSSSARPERPSLA